MSLLRPTRGLALGAALLLAGSGCSTDDQVPECVNCEFWTQLSPGLGRYGEPHPSDAGYLLFSTVEKSAGAPDADRDTDEDIWLLERSAAGTAPAIWQITDDALGTGDNFGARWSPSGTQVAFVHTTAGGRFEIWRVPVTLPPAPGAAPVIGVPERLVNDARDVAWATETELLFSRNSKLFRVGIPIAPGPPTTVPAQLTFDPPTFASTEKFVDRHPMFAPDGGAVFTTIGRQNVADVWMRAFEVDDRVFPPDTTETAAWISYQAGGANTQYPLFLGADTLRTPRLLRSVPVGAGGTFNLGVRRDSRFLPPETESYCDTTLVVRATLQPAGADTLEYYFRVVRGALEITSGTGQTNVFWTRTVSDFIETINDYTSSTLLSNLGDRLQFRCLLPFVITGTTVDTSLTDTFLVTGSRSSLKDTVLVQLTPGTTTKVRLFPPGTVSGTLAFTNNPPVPPAVSISARLAGTTELLSNATSNVGTFRVNNLPTATYDLTFVSTGYQTLTLTNVSVTELQDTALGTVTMMPTPGPAAIPAADVPEMARATAGITYTFERPRPPDSPASLASPFRAEGDETTVWRLEFDPASQAIPPMSELFGSIGLIQDPVVTEEFAGGVRYVAFVSDESGRWRLYVRRLVNWVPDPPPPNKSGIEVATPGSSENFNCDRSVFQPRWLSGSTPGNLRLVVSMSDCPDNGFEQLGFDDDPWALGEVRVWEVELPPGL